MPDSPVIAPPREPGFSFSLSLQVETGFDDPARHLPHHHHLVLFQKARLAYLDQFGYTERNIEGRRMFIVEANCRYLKELFDRDAVEVRCRVDDLRSKVFSMRYSIEKDGDPCALGYTRSVCVDTATRRSVFLPEAFVTAVRRFEGLI